MARILSLHYRDLYRTGLGGAPLWNLMGYYSAINHQQASATGGSSDWTVVGSTVAAAAESSVLCSSLSLSLSLLPLAAPSGYGTLTVRSDGYPWACVWMGHLCSVTPVTMLQPRRPPTPHGVGYFCVFVLLFLCCHHVHTGRVQY